MTPVVLDGSNLTIENVYQVAYENVSVQLAEAAIDRMRSSRRVIEKAIVEDRIIYGVNTGFGKLSDVHISPEKVADLQLNLLRSHAAGVGKPLPEAFVRAIMVTKANTLAKGYSGIRPEVVELLVDLLNHAIHPVIPEKGSVGACGDLAPLAHLSLVLVGEGEAFFAGERVPGAQALRRASLVPETLQAKEGLSLINGTQYMAGLGALAVKQAEELLKLADIAAAMNLEALMGTPTAFDSRIQAARGQLGQIASAENLRALMAGSQIREAHRYCPRVQDPYSLRCTPQVHGASRDAVKFVRSVIEQEINAATDNPLVFTETEDVLSGGNFHGQPVALALDVLAIALAEVGNIAECRVALSMDGAQSGLPYFLAQDPGLNSGFMIAQVTAASLVAENKILCHPASVDSLPTSAGKEDHVSMGALAVQKLWKVIENTEQILAIEFLCGAQGLDFRKPLKPGSGVGKAYDMIRATIPPLQQDRSLTPDIADMIQLMRSAQFLEEVERITPLK